MPRRSRSTHRIALHEAGHAVMAYVSGRRLGPMTSIPRGAILGQLEYRGFTTFSAAALDEARARKKLETEIMIALAGLAAEQLMSRRVDKLGAIMDLQRALEVAFSAIADPDEATAFINWLFVRTRNRLRTPACARAIAALATALDRRGALTGREVRAILDAASAGPRRFVTCDELTRTGPRVGASKHHGRPGTGRTGRARPAGRERAHVARASHPHRRPHRRA